MDVFRCVPLAKAEGLDRARSLPNLADVGRTGSSLIGVTRAAFSARRKGCAWAWRQGNRVIGLASARRRSGLQSWEVTHLLLVADLYDGLPDLLDRVARTIASYGGQRLFLRLRQDDPAVDAVRTCGFFPSVHEVLFVRPPRGDDIPHHADPDDGAAIPRQKRRADVHDMFRLYNAAIPPKVRADFGMTFDQWSASREPARGRSTELVVEGDAGLAAWLRTMRWSGVGQLHAMACPGHEPELARLVDYGLARLGRAQTVRCLVADYQVALEDILTDRGFRAAGDFVTLIRSMTVRARGDVGVRATAVS